MITRYAVVESEGERLALDFLPAWLLADLAAVTFHDRLGRAEIGPTFNPQSDPVLPFEDVRWAHEILLFGRKDFWLGTIRIRSVGYSDARTELRNVRSSAARPRWTFYVEYACFPATSSLKAADALDHADVEDHQRN